MLEAVGGWLTLTRCDTRINQTLLFCMHEDARQLRVPTCTRANNGQTHVQIGYYWQHRQDPYLCYALPKSTLNSIDVLRKTEASFI